MNEQQLVRDYLSRGISLYFQKSEQIAFLHPDETCLIEGIKSPKRCAELITGRYCAHHAVRQLGLDDTEPVLLGDHDQPLWGPGIAGSISHSDNCYCAAVVATNRYLSVGIDCESVHRVIKDSVWDLVLNEDEVKWIKDYPSPLIRSTLFSAKESFYKMMFPLVKWKFYFDAVSALNPEEDAHLILELKRDLSPAYRTGMRFRADVHYDEDHLITLMVLNR